MNATAQELLIKLAKQANKDRFYPFPGAYRQTKTNDVELFNTPYTDLEYYNMLIDLNKIEVDNDEAPELRAHITNMDISVVKHTSDTKILEEYEFQYSKLDERIRILNHKKRWYLYHGSPIGNWYSIMRNGIKNMSNTKFMTCGAAFGVGVYMSNNMNIAYNYGANSYYGRGTKTVSCVAVVELLHDPTAFEKSPGIYVVPDDTYIVPRYMYIIRDPNVVRHNNTFANNLAFYQKCHEKKTTMPQKMHTRIIKDLEAMIAVISPDYTITPADISEITKHEKFTIKGNGVNLTFHIDLYPMIRPLVYNNDKKLYMPVIDWLPTTKLLDVVIYEINTLRG